MSSAEPPKDAKEKPLRPRGLQRLDAASITFLAFLALVVGSLGALSGSGRDLDHLANLRRFAGRFFPPDFSVLPGALEALVETGQIATMATFFALLLAVPFGLAGAQNLSPRPLVLLTRLLLNMVRTVPSLIWALCAVAIVGPTPLAGVIGLTFYSLGYLGKFFSDALESTDTAPTDALRALGASRVQAFQYATWPSVRPTAWSHALWMLEYNVRSASIVGYVGAGGIGVQLHTYQEFHAWDRFATVLLVILVIVTLLDFLGETVRARVLRRQKA